VHPEVIGAIADTRPRPLNWEWRDGEARSASRTRGREELLAMLTLVQGATVIQDATRVITGGAVAFDGDRIEAVGSFDQLRARWPDAPLLGGPDRLVMPGLANAHDHGRGVSTYDWGLTDGVLEVWRLEQSGRGWPSPYLQTLSYGLQMLRSGITTVVHHHSPAGIRPGGLLEHAGAALRGYRDAGLRVCFALGAWDQLRLVYGPEQEFLARLSPDTAAAVQQRLGEPVGLDETVATARALVDESAGSNIAVYLGPFAAQWCSPELHRALREAADALGTGRHMHLLETPYQKLWVDRTYGRSIVAVLDEWGAVDERLTCAHGVWLTDADLELLARRGACVSHNPSSNLRLQSGIARLNDLLANGVTVGLGLDGMGFLSQDLFAEMRLATALGRPPGLDSPAVASQTVFRLATQGGTRAALGRSDLGQLAPGHPADLVVLDATRLTPYTAVPRDPVDLVVWRGRPELVETVIVAGETLLDQGRPTRADPDDVARRLNAELAETFAHQTEAPWWPEFTSALRHYYDGWNLETRGWEPARSV
jgi:cytosine/adenosine deaminase-related metal-dependent hydrolase